MFCHTRPFYEQPVVIFQKVQSLSAPVPDDDGADLFKADQILSYRKRVHGFQ